MPSLPPGSKETREARSAELRRRLDASRAKLDASIDVLSRRAERNSDPLQVMRNHPVAAAAVGLALGYVLVRRPRWLVEGVRRIGTAALPVITSTLLGSLGSEK